MFKQPPSRHAGELPSSEAIGLAVGRDGRQQVEEVEYDARTSSVFDAEGNEGLERVASVVRVCRSNRISSAVPLVSCWVPELRRTLLSYFK